MGIFNEKYFPIIVIDKNCFDTKFFAGKVLNKSFFFVFLFAKLD